MILIALCLVFLLALAALGGRIGNLASIQVRLAWLAPLAFLMQAYPTFFPGLKAGGLLSGRSLILILSHGLVFVVIWYNRRLTGAKLIGLGLLLNFLVMVLNGGFMPITPEALVQTGYEINAPRLETGYLVARSKNTVMEHGEARLWFLSDILVLPGWFPIPSAFSVGDVLIAAGMFFLLRAAMMGKSLPTSI